MGAGVRLQTQDRDGAMAAYGDTGRLIRALTADDAAATLLWLIILPLLAAAAGLFFAIGFRVQDSALPSKLGLYLTGALVAQIALLRCLAPRLSRALVALAQMGAISTVGMLLAYAAAAAAMPLVDGQLLALDQAIGYEWRDYAGFIARHRAIAFALDHAYMLIFGLPFLAIGPLAQARRFRAIDRYLIATAIALLITTAIFTFCPALTAWDHLGIAPDALKPFRYLPNATAGWEYELLQIRAGRGFVLHDTLGSGLVAFPSFHAIAALLFAAALWPLRALRAPAALAAFLVILSAPILGGHYAIDLIAGAAVATASLLVATPLERTLHEAAARLAR